MSVSASERPAPVKKLRDRFADHVLSIKCKKCDHVRVTDPHKRWSDCGRFRFPQPPNRRAEYTYRGPREQYEQNDCDEQIGPL